jgi:hypothetical protein
MTIDIFENFIDGYNKLYKKALVIADKLRRAGYKNFNDYDIVAVEITRTKVIVKRWTDWGGLSSFGDYPINFLFISDDAITDGVVQSELEQKKKDEETYILYGWKSGHINLEELECFFYDKANEIVEMLCEIPYDCLTIESNPMIFFEKNRVVLREYSHEWEETIDVAEFPIEFLCLRHDELKDAVKELASKNK